MIDCRYESRCNLKCAVCPGFLSEKKSNQFGTCKDERSPNYGHEMCALACCIVVCKNNTKHRGM